MQTLEASQIEQRITKMIQETKSKEGVTLYDHICLLYEEFLHQPKNAYSKDLDQLAQLSQFIKKNCFQYRPPKTDQQIKQQQEPSNYYQQDYVEKILNLINEAKISKSDSIVPNFVQQNSLLELAGVGFHEEEAWLIQNSLKRFIQQQQGLFVQVRFWGKILTNGRDYYVLETLSKFYSKEDLPQDSEQNGQGINEYVHYVTQDLSDDWQLLPCITRKQMEVSRLIKYVFSGNLERQPVSYPIFEGREKHLLKAQITRITHSNLISPRGLYKLSDDNPKMIEFEEEFKMPEPNELASLETWVHVPLNILKLGRVSHWVDQSLSEEIKQQKLDELVAEDPELDRLKSISEDKAVEGYETGWLVKSFGESQQYNTPEDVQVSYGIYILKNLLWPGAITVSNKSSYVNIYIGYGQKFNQAAFVPITPNDIQEEPEDNLEYPEPNPQTLADELEPDSDDERRKLQEQLEAEQNQ